MKKLILYLVALLVVAVGGYLLSTGMIPGIGGDRSILRTQSIRFFECLKFKEFTEAANFHSVEDRKDADIPNMIEDLFRIPPEYLDIQDISVLFVEIDTSGDLAKTKTRCHVKELNSAEERNHEIILYWKREGEDWNLKLRSSLERF